MDDERPEAVCRVVDAMPPPSPEQVVRLRPILAWRIPARRYDTPAPAEDVEDGCE